MELTNKMIEKYLKSSKKQKSQMITQYCELTHVKRATAVKRFERGKKKYLFKEGKNNSKFNDINMIQPVHSFNDNLL